MCSETVHRSVGPSGTGLVGGSVRRAVDPSARRPVGPSSRQSAGFTILEAVVAVTIVGLAAVSSLAAFGAELRATDRARSALEAEALAQERYAQLVLLRPTVLRQLPDSLREGTFAVPFDRYHWAATAREVVGNRGLVEVGVEVQWDSGKYPLTARLYRPLPREHHAQ